MREGKLSFAKQAQAGAAPFIVVGVEDAGHPTISEGDGRTQPSSRPGGEGRGPTKPVQEGPAAIPYLKVGTALLGLVTATAVAVKAASWPAVVGFDGWAYTMWGQSLARGEGLAFKGQTIPKPLPITLSFMTSWLPDAWGPIVIMSVAVGGLVAGLLWSGTALRGAIAGGAAVIAIFLSTTVDSLLEMSDGVCAACIVWAVATRGRWRIGLFVLAGLLRPEAWPLAFIAGYFESRGPDRKHRVIVSLASGFAAPVLWMAFDWILAGDPLASMHWLQAARLERAGGGPAPLVPKSASDAITTLKAVLAPDAPSLIVLLAGIPGLVMLSRRVARPPARSEPYPLIVFVTGLVTLVAFFIVVAELYERYMLPFTLTMLSLGAGCLLGTLVRKRISVVPVAAACIVFILVGTWRLDVSPFRKRTAAVTEKAATSLPAVRAVADCGRIAVSGNWRARSYIPFLAGLSGMSARKFVVNNDPDGKPLVPGPHVGAIIKLHAGRGGRLPDWPTHRIPLGILAIRPGCSP